MSGHDAVTLALAASGTAIALGAVLAASGIRSGTEGRLVPAFLAAAGFALVLAGLLVFLVTVAAGLAAG